MRLFSQLRLLVSSITASISALVWSIIFLTLVQAISAIFMTQVVQESLATGTLSDPANEKVREKVFNHFGRWSHSLLTMYEITLAPGRWVSIGRTLIFEVDMLFWL